LKEVAVSPVTLTPVDQLQEAVEAVLARALPYLGVLLPYAELHHIGATAISGALSKGDVDVLVRVSSEDFKLAVDTLKQHFALKQPDHWSAEFASFGNDEGYALPLGIQVVVESSGMDFFLFLRDYFKAGPDAVEEYNALKIAHADEGEEAYWQAKDTFLAEILASRDKLSDGETA
jgi:GrpB-like predicted nucleotidyltransferase (UPF0157 family)